MVGRHNNKITDSPMSLQARLIKAVTRRTIKRSGLNEQQLVRHLRKVFNDTPVLTLLPRGVTLSRVQQPAFTGDRISVKQPSMTVLYIHGGAYIGGITKTYHNLAGRLAKKLNAEVFLPVYPFAPEHPYPAAVNRVMEAYEYLLSLGKKPQDIVIAGDSAGGGLTLATLLHIRDKGLEQPRCAVTFSPGSNAFPDDKILDALDPAMPCCLPTLSAPLSISISPTRTTAATLTHPPAWATTPASARYSLPPAPMKCCTPMANGYDAQPNRPALEWNGLNAPAYSMCGPSWCRSSRKRTKT